MRSFFHVLSVAEAIEKLVSFPILNAEPVPLHAALGRVLAEDVQAREDLPLAARSSMDGYAVRAEDLFGAGESAPSYLECVAQVAVDKPSDRALAPGECAGIVTGGILPEGADAVVMVEHTSALEGDESGGAVRGTVEMRRAVAPGENVMLRGEDAEAGSVALGAGTRLRPQEIGLLAALGCMDVPVGRLPRAAVLSTGDEVIPIDQTPRPGQVRDVNGPALAAMIARAGGVPVPLGLVRDEEPPLEKALRDGLEQSDAVFLSGGSSVGVRDLTLSVVSRLPGAQILAHGVAMRPGKPLVLARVEQGGAVKAIFGLPGQVTSAQVVMHVLGLPFLRRLMGDPSPFSWQRRALIPAVMGRNVASRQGREDYVRVRFERSLRSDQLLAQPVLGPSGLLRTLVEADGLVRIPAGDEGLYEGRTVMVCPLWQPGEEPEGLS
ncbi:molybdopterin molybdenumtransferase MoeA [Oceanidesulfovibrio indonesiensis]|uniref:Molybdopterin molybdenumtransferase n=1 Tax=Oceanidesulfovibrio indonesiensis TaxID=54767 RepID=A0A7M3MBB3_9BACT|nr:gephyrin-like molybdotransferase Glp [Oceanidesulfovibrio indonesiensis]TVM15409.1 molybdopterin molybdenumtransferase MoeA [Oceanidesulfovibrio indonesiensis]